MCREPWLLTSRSDRAQKKKKGKEISAEEITTGKMRSFLLQTKIVNSDGIYNWISFSMKHWYTLL